jgi:hypothetical protein
MATEAIYNDTVVTDRLALSRAQHLQSRDNRPKSVSDDETDAISDWSESDRECCLLSDFESTSNVDGTIGSHNYNIPFDDDDDDDDDEMDEKLPIEATLLENVLRINETPLPIINDSTTSTHISFSYDIEKPHQQISDEIIQKAPIQSRKQSQQPLLPGRRVQRQQVSPTRSITNSHILSQSTNSSRHRKTITPSPSRLYLRRETTSTNTSLNNQLIKDITLSPNSSFHSNEENNQNHQRHTASPNLSQTSTTNGLVPRVYEFKKLFNDDYDYGRLTDVSTLRSVPPRNRQKWGTIVHPPFPLGYQQITSEQVTQAVERLASPVRCRDRHTPLQTPSKRYLSVEETDALVTGIVFLNYFHVFFCSFR